MTTSPRYRMAMSPRSPSALSIASVPTPLREEVAEFKAILLPPPALDTELSPSSDTEAVMEAVKASNDGVENA